jgi:DGQHR domain-containing protein
MKNVRALIMRQKSTILYSFTMNALELEPLCFVEAASRDKQKGLQRVTEASRLREIGDYLSDDESGLLPNNVILNLRATVTITHDEDEKTATLSFPSDEGEYAFVVDGQHRLFSFRKEYRKLDEGQLFELPVVAFHNASEELVGATFVSININQKPVNRDLLTQMKAILGLLNDDLDRATIDLIHAIDEDKHSPLFNRILRFPKEKHKWVKTNQLLAPVKALLLPGGCLHEKTHAERKRIVVDYLRAIAGMFPEAWKDEKRSEFALLQPSSLQIVITLLADVMQRCDFYEKFIYNHDAFRRQLQPLAEIALLSHWKKTQVDEALSTAPKREMFLGSTSSCFAAETSFGEARRLTNALIPWPLSP